MKALRGREPYWILEGQQPVPCRDLLRFALWMDDAAKSGGLHVGDDSFALGGDRVRVSTVFLGRNSGLFAGETVLFETMVFRSEGNHTYRYSTWEEAAAGHAVWVEFFEACQYDRVEEGKGYADSDEKRA